jgi:hypothetical protein
MENVTGAEGDAEIAGFNHHYRLPVTLENQHTTIAQYCFAQNHFNANRPGCKSWPDPQRLEKRLRLDVQWIGAAQGMPPPVSRSAF